MYPAAFGQQSQTASEELEVARLAAAHHDASGTQDGAASSIFGTNTPNSHGYGSQEDESDDSNSIQSPIELRNVKSEKDQEDEPEIEYRSVADDSMRDKAGSGRQASRKKRKTDNSVIKPIAKRMARSCGMRAETNDEVITVDDTDTPSTSTQNQAARNSATILKAMLDEFGKMSVEIEKHEGKLKTLQAESATIKSKLKKCPSADSNYDILLEEFRKVSITIDECDNRLKVLKTHKDTIAAKINRRCQK